MFVNNKRNNDQNEFFNNIFKNFRDLSSNYDNFLASKHENNARFKDLTKQLYGHCQKLQQELKFSLQNKNKEPPKSLRNLLIENFDDEQVWEQLELFNQPFTNHTVSEISQLIASKLPLSLNVEIKSFKRPKVGVEEQNILKSRIENAEKKQKKVKFTEGVEKQKEKVDFFDLNEMEKFLEENDEENPIDNDDDIDYFADIPSDEDSEDEEQDAMYSDFFDPPKSLVSNGTEVHSDNDEDLEKEDEDDSVGLDTRDVNLDEAESSDGEDDVINKRLRALANNDPDPDEADLEGKSDYEKSQIRLQRKIQKAEQDLLLPHNTHWQLSGETTGQVRPTNSILEEHLQFDHISRPAPLITDETTSTLESIIKQRIKDKVFDDVERKSKPKEQPFEFRRRVMLESEKSKVGLAEVYEQEYLRQQQKHKEEELGARINAFIAPGEVEESETRKELRKTWRSLLRKLNSLSAFHYTPRAPEPEVKIINNLPAITVEEAVPEATSDMKLLAPEEVYSTRNKKVLQDKNERTKTDKNRARRLKKKKQGIKQKFLQSKLKLQKNKNKSEAKKSKLEAIEDSKSLTSSSKFFQRLQEKNEMAKAEKKAKPKITIQPNLSKKLKL